MSEESLGSRDSFLVQSSGEGSDEDVAETDQRSSTDDELFNVPTPNGIAECLGASSSLETRLQQEVRCVICKTMPFSELYQCQRGHLFCAGCYQVRVLDKMLGTQLGTCPECQVRIYRREATRNLVAERAVAEMPMECEQCGAKLARSSLRRHSLLECQQRTLSCRYKRLGCSWRGAAPTAASHEAECEWRLKTGAQLLEELRKRQEEHDAEQQVLPQLLGMLQLPKITVRLLQVIPRLAAAFPCNELVTIAGFRAFSQRWSVRLMWEAPQDGRQLPAAEAANLSCSFLFQLQLESPAECQTTLVINYTLVRGTHSEISFQRNMQKFEFSSEHVLSPPTLFYKNSWGHCDKLLHERGITGRLILAHT